jgi:Calx-beta domain
MKYVAVFAALLGIPYASADALSTVTILAIDPAASEAGPKAATIMVARNDGDLTRPLVVPLSITGSATAGTDYAPLASSIAFAANVPLVMLKVTPIKDAIAEGEETVVLALVPKAGAYLLGEENKATVTIADAGSASMPSSGAADPRSMLPPPDRTGTLSVAITFDGRGTWKHPKNGAYSNLKFHRELLYTVPLRGSYGAGSGIAELGRRYPVDIVNVNFKRYLVGQPRDAIAPAGTYCGAGTVTIADESSGMEVGDPGQPPLVPFTQTVKGGGKYPSGDRTVPERNLCETYAIIDNQRHVLHLRLDGSDAFVKVTNVHNGHTIPPYNLRLQGDAVDAKAKFSLSDLPIPANALAAEGSKVIENASSVGGPMSSTFPLTATVKWKLQMK